MRLFHSCLSQLRVQSSPHTLVPRSPGSGVSSASTTGTVAETAVTGESASSAGGSRAAAATMAPLCWCRCRCVLARQVAIRTATNLALRAELEEPLFCHCLRTHYRDPGSGLHMVPIQATARVHTAGECGSVLEGRGETTRRHREQRTASVCPLRVLDGGVRRGDVAGCWVLLLSQTGTRNQVSSVGCCL